MAKSSMFQYAALWHPNKKQEEEGMKSKLIVEIKTILCVDQKEAGLRAVMEIPAEYKDQLDQVELLIRPF